MNLPAIFPIDAVLASRKRVWAAAALALALPYAMLLLRWSLPPEFASRPFLVLFVPAMFAPALLGGLWPGLLATVVTALLSDYYLVRPVGQFGFLSTVDFFQWLTLAASGLLASVMAETLHRARERARGALDGLRRSERRFDLLVDNIRDHAIYMLDVNGNVQTWSAGAADLKRYDAAEILGRSFRQFYTQEDIQAGTPDTLLRRAAAEGRVETSGWRLRKGGEPFYADVSISAIRDDAGELRGFSKITRDATERLMAAQSSAALLETIRQRFIMSVTDADGNIVEVNDAFCGISGYSREELIGANHRLLKSGEHDPEFYKALWARISSGQSWRGDFCNRARDGTLYWVDSVIAPFRGPDGRVERYVSIRSDISSRKRVERELAAKHELLSVTFKSIGDAVITTRADSSIDWMNPAAERLTGWLGAEARGLLLARVMNVLDERSRKPADCVVACCLARGATCGRSSPALLISRDGREYGVEDLASPLRNDRGQVLGAVVVFRDVTEQRRIAVEMRRRAIQDPLTGLVNRAEFEERLRRTLEKARAERHEHAMLFIDLDQFKLVNDACGHAAGDELLKRVSQIFAESARARDTLARLGGDEFAIILEHCSAEQAQRVAQAICGRMDDFRFQHEGRGFRIGASIGLVPVNEHWVDTQAILQAADMACSAAKEAGRNRVHTWFDTDQSMRARQGEMRWANRITQALDENRFVLHLQHIVPMPGTGGRPMAELLLRLVERNGKIFAPGAFLPAAERFNLVSRLDRWVLGAAMAWVRGQGDHGEDPPRPAEGLVCINLSGQSVGDPSFQQFAVERLEAAGAAVAGRLCFEISESFAAASLAEAVRFIDRVRALGVRVALDDFGAGASSFGYLKSMKVDFLKIDGQFIRNLVEDPLSDVAVRSFCAAARVMGVRTVAEFVERPELMPRLAEIGVDYAQGFLIHEPEPLVARAREAGAGAR